MACSVETGQLAVFLELPVFAALGSCTIGWLMRLPAAISCCEQRDGAMLCKLAVSAVSAACGHEVYRAMLCCASERARLQKEDKWGKEQSL